MPAAIASVEGDFSVGRYVCGHTDELRNSLELSRLWGGEAIDKSPPLC